MKYEGKIWLNVDGLEIGVGRIELLKSLKRTGSISSAAKELSMSYRYTWEIVKRMAALNPPLVKIKRGGPGGVEVTEEGERIINEFCRVKDAVRRILAYGPAPSLTVDGVVVKGKEVLLVRRANDPFRGMWALPGGFVNYGERLEEAVIREVKEETGLDCSVKRFIGFADKPDRDPRGHTISAVFLLEVRGGEIKGGDDASEARFFPLKDLPPLAFDHAEILKRSIPLLKKPR
ncbi:MAG: NUDIX domain-containing protein [Thermoplasmata archaeon]|nr:NUDIX domain-containing protein [Thermoplasmata archaeon]